MMGCPESKFGPRKVTASKVARRVLVPLVILTMAALRVAPAVAAEGADLAVAKVVDNPNPSMGDTVTFTVTLTNNGPKTATGIDVTDSLPPGLSYLWHQVTSGSYDQATGIWSLILQKDRSEILTLVAVVDPGAIGSTIVNTATVTASSNSDPVPGNNSNSASITVGGFDLQVTKTVDNPNPTEGETVAYLVAVSNTGVSQGTGIEITDLLPVGVSYVSDTPSQGSYDDATGLWTLGSLTAGDSATLNITASVEPGTAGSTITNTASLTAVDQSDGYAANDSDTADVDPLSPPASTIAIQAVELELQPVIPGGQPQDALRLELVNTGVVQETLRSITLTNNASGPGSPDQLDADWSRVELLIEQAGNLVSPATALPGAPTAGAFSAGTLTIADLAIPLAPQDTVRLVVRGEASLAARDGDLMAVAVLGPGAVGFAQPVNQIAAWPLAPPPALVVDGMVADQLDLRPVEAGAFIAGSARNLALDVALPPNGYEGDRLDRLNVVNLGDARPQLDILRMEAFADDGDDDFDPGLDVLLGAFAFTGSRWELTGLSHEVPLAGLRIYVAVEVATNAEQGRSIRLSLPTLPDVGIGMFSGNDGPIDVALVNPYLQTVSTGDRIVLSTAPVPAGAVYPGQEDVTLFHLVATNTYTVAKRLTGLNFLNGTESQMAAQRSDLDGEVEQLLLRRDGDGNGQLDDPATDPVIGTASFVAGGALFSGLSWDLQAGQSQHLFLTADVSAQSAADGDVLSAAIATGADLGFADPTAIVAEWPLDSGGRQTVNGMVAAQINSISLPPAALAANDGPILALDVTVPANGYATDVLNGLELINRGTAQAGDLSDLRLWQDGGDGLFSDGGGDDLDLGPLVWLAGSWKSPALSTAIPISGLRLFVAMTVAAAPTDSATVRFAIPVNGITTASDNDGPVDVAVDNPNDFLLSTAPLLASLSFDALQSTVGQDITVQMKVRNVGGEDVLGITPSVLLPAGDGGLTLAGGPTPPGFDLASGQIDSFTWTYTAAAKGQVRLVGSAEGTGAVGGLARKTLSAATDAHRIYEPTDELALFPLANMPLSISRGQTDVVPLTLTMRNAGLEGASSVMLQGLTIQLLDENGGGIVPADLLQRVSVSEGTIFYVQKTELETSGNAIDLNLSTPVQLTAGEMVTLALKLDHLPSATISAFRVIISDDSAFVASDAISGLPVTVTLQEGVYPVASGLCRIVAEATGLAVVQEPSSGRRVGQGQADVPLLTLRLENNGLDDLSADVQIGAFQIGLVDADGNRLPNPGQVIQRVRARGTYLTYVDRPLGGEDDTLLTLFLSPPLSVPANTPIPLTLYGDIAEAAAVQTFRLRLADALLFDARDGNTGAAVPVSYVPASVEGESVSIEVPATNLVAAGTAGLPSTLTIGARGVVALTVRLDHPGSGGTAPIRVNWLRFFCQNASRNPVSTEALIDLLAVQSDGVEIGSLPGSAGSGGFLTVPLSGVLIEPGTNAELSVILDVEATAPATSLELIVDAGGIEAVDANLGHPVAIAPAPAEIFPLSSGLTRLQPPADELVVDFESRMPVVLSADGAEIFAATFHLTNPAEAGNGSIAIERLTVRAADGRTESLVLGSAAAQVAVYQQGQLWAASPPLTSADTVAVLAGGQALQVEPSETIAVELAVRFRSSPPVNGFRLGVEQQDIGVTQPDGALLAVRVVPAPGDVFPFWTQPGTFTTQGLQSSYSNFPNPFAAGREVTTFVYSLPQAASVTLRIMTPYWEVVRTIASDEWRDGGLHQQDEWDGRNGRGVAVQNGVYVAELEVRFEDGTAEKVLRKVAVVR